MMLIWYLCVPLLSSSLPVLVSQRPSANPHRRVFAKQYHMSRMCLVGSTRWPCRAIGAIRRKMDDHAGQREKNYTKTSSNRLLGGGEHMLHATRSLLMSLLSRASESSKPEKGNQTTQGDRSLSSKARNSRSVPEQDAVLPLRQFTTCTTHVRPTTLSSDGFG